MHIETVKLIQTSPGVVIYTHTRFYSLLGCCLAWKNVLPSTRLTKERQFSGFSFSWSIWSNAGYTKTAVHVAIAEQATQGAINIFCYKDPHTSFRFKVDLEQNMLWKSWMLTCSSSGRARWLHSLMSIWGQLCYFWRQKLFKMRPWPAL